MRKFSIPCQFGEAKSPFNVYVGEPAPDAHPLWAQVQWLREERGGEIPAEVLNSFQQLLDLANERKLSFEEMCRYAIDGAGSAGKDRAELPLAGIRTDILPDPSQLDSVALNSMYRAAQLCEPGTPVDTRRVLLALAQVHALGRWDRIWLRSGHSSEDIAVSAVQDSQLGPGQVWNSMELTATCAQCLRAAASLSLKHGMPIGPGILMLGLLADPATGASQALGVGETIEHDELRQLVEEELLGFVGLVAAETLVDLDGSRPTSSLAARAEELRDSYRRTTSPADLDSAIAAYQALVDTTPDGHDFLPSYLSGLAILLTDRFRGGTAKTDLDSAVQAHEASMAVAPDDYDHRYQRLILLGTALQLRYDHFRDRADLDSAIDAFRASLETLTTAHRHYRTALTQLRQSLVIRAEDQDDHGDLDNAIELGRELTTLTPAGPLRADVLTAHAGSLQRRFRRSKDVADLNEALAARRNASQAVNPESPDRARYLTYLAVTLTDRAEHSGALEDLDEAITTLRLALEAEPDAGPARAQLYSSLGHALQARYRYTSLRPDLDEAIAATKAAITGFSQDGHGYAEDISNLAIALRALYELSHDPADLNTAVDLLQTAISITPVGKPVYAALCSNLGITLQVRFDRTGALADLDASVAASRAAASTGTPDDPERASRLANLAVTLRTRFERVGDLSSLTEAVTASRSAVSAASADHPDRVRILTGFASILQRQYERSGDLSDLDAAVTISRTCVEATSAGDPMQAASLATLASLLRARFNRTAMIADIREAAEAGRGAVDVTPTDQDMRLSRLANLANILEAKFAREGERSDLEEATIAARMAAQATPADHPARPLRLLTQAGVAFLRFQADGAGEDLDEAVVASRAANDATPADHAQRASMLDGLSQVLLMRYERGGDTADLDEALGASVASAAARSDDQADTFHSLYQLGLVRLARFRHNGDTTDREAAVNALASAARLRPAMPTMRIRAARVAAELIADADPGLAADLLESAVLLLPEVSPRRLGRADQQHSISRHGGLTADAAALVLSSASDESGELAAIRALRLLEAGRAVMLSQVLETRSDLTDLRESRPELARRLASLRDRLDDFDETRAMAAAASATNTPGHEGRRAASRNQLAADLGRTLAEIRELAGFGDFGRPPPADDLLAQASAGPIVVFNVSRYRSDALLLHAGTITCCPLPDLSRSAVIEKSNAFHQGLREMTTGTVGPERQLVIEAAFCEILEWLWDAAAGPVLHTLGFDREPPPDHVDAEARWPRIWWIPGGLLGMLPLHAAGYHAEPPAAGQARRTVLDRVISSYTPTIRVLDYARSRDHRPAADGRTLLVAMPTTPGLPHKGALPNVGVEIRRLSLRLPRPVILAEPDAYAGTMSALPASELPTRANVFAHLPDCAIAHFSCHGYNHPTDPSQSMLLLHDHNEAPLTVASLAPLNLSTVQLAYLSACSTALTSDVALVDEAVHLTSAFQLAGFPHVIGTLWPIYDRVAVEISDGFYQCLQTGPGRLDTRRAAYSLHTAIREARDGQPRSPFRWAAYIHAGI